MAPDAVCEIFVIAYASVARPRFFFSFLDSGRVFTGSVDEKAEFSFEFMLGFGESTENASEVRAPKENL